MAVAPLRRRAGKIEIQEKERKAREEAKKSGEKMKKEITPQEEAERIRILKEAGLLK